MPLFETDRVELPKGQWATVKEMSVGELREADQKGTEVAAAMMRLLPEKIVESQMQKSRENALERIIRYEGYDPETLLKYGIIEWSFEEECTHENIAKLGAQLGEIIGRRIFELSVLPSGEVGASSPSVNGDASSLASGEPMTSGASEEGSPSPSMIAPQQDS